jgi:hypothetical protein
MVAYFLLFDFFSDSYSRFQGIWVKSTLYLFATTTTVSVASEWFYFNNNTHLYEEISLISELIAGVFCYILIILQFFPFHFKTQYLQHIAREALIFQQTLYAANTKASFSINQAIDTMKSEEQIDNNSIKVTF